VGFSGKVSDYVGFALFSMAASVVTASLLVVLKSYAYSVSGSASVLASLTDSASDLGVSMIAFFSVHYALKPADKEHRHGHGNMEGVTALFQSALMVAAALFLGVESVSRLADPSPITLEPMAVGALILSLLFSIGLVWLQKRSLKKAASLIVEADKAHYSMDIAINAATLLVLLLVGLGLPAIIDSGFALVVSGYLAYTALSIGRKALDMLLDRELPDEERERIKSLIRANPGVWGFHDLRTNQSGILIFISFDIAVDPNLSLREAHAIAKDVEESIMKTYPRAEVLIHVDPADDTDDARHKKW
jgi:ferrous-iron efflux pump FieF